MRSLVLLVALFVSGNVQAQFPYSYAPYIPRYPPIGAYVPPIENQPPQSISQAMLGAHNAVRAQVGVPPLVWSSQLTNVAQDWANHLVVTGGLSHRPNNRYGENIYTISGRIASPIEVVDLWAAEARRYDARSNTCLGVCGHYTQLVWAETRAVGCAVASNPQREVWVCNYDPPGNVIGDRPY